MVSDLKETSSVTLHNSRFWCSAGVSFEVVRSVHFHLLIWTLASTSIELFEVLRSFTEADGWCSVENVQYLTSRNWPCSWDIRSPRQQASVHICMYILHLDLGLALLRTPVFYAFVTYGSCTFFCYLQQLPDLILYMWSHQWLQLPSGFFFFFTVSALFYPACGFWDVPVFFSGFFFGFQSWSSNAQSSNPTAVSSEAAHIKQLLARVCVCDPFSLLTTFALHVCDWGCAHGHLCESLFPLLVMYAGHVCTKKLEHYGKCNLKKQNVFIS